MKDNSTGKDKEFYALGKKMFDRIQVSPEHQSMIQRGVDRTTPPKREWVGLTDDEVYKIAFALEGEHWRKIADAIEAKLKERNT